MKCVSLFSFAAVLLSLNFTPVGGAVLFTFEEVGDDVVATTSGSIGTGWSSNVSSSITGNGNSFLNSTAIVAQSSAGGNRYYGPSGLFTLNNSLPAYGSPNQDGVTTGDYFGFNNNNNFYTPASVNEGEAFSPNTTITWSNETFSTLKLDTALSETPLVLFTLNNNDSIGARLTAIPEPNSYGFLLGAVGLATAIFFRRRRRPSAV